MGNTMALHAEIDDQHELVRNLKRQNPYSCAAAAAELKLSRLLRTYEDTTGEKYTPGQPPGSSFASDIGAALAVTAAVGVVGTVISAAVAAPEEAPAKIQQPPPARTDNTKAMLTVVKELEVQRDLVTQLRTQLAIRDKAMEDKQQPPPYRSETTKPAILTVVNELEVQRNLAELKVASTDEPGAALTGNEVALLKDIEAQREQIVNLKSELANLQAENADVKVSQMTDGNEQTSAMIAELRRELALRDVEIAEHKEELNKTTTSLQTVISLKNREIKDLKDEVRRLKQDTSKNTGNLGLTISDKTVPTLNAEMDNIQQMIATINGRMDNLLNGTSQNTIRARFEEISLLTSDRKYSHVLSLAGNDWAIGISKIDEYLRVELHAMRVESRCSAFFKFQLLSHKSENNFHTKGATGKTSVFDSGSDTWGYPRFIMFKDLFDDEKGYVEDDAIIISVSIKAFIRNDA